MGPDNRGDLRVLGVLILAATVFVAVVALLLAPVGQDALAVLSDGVGLKSAFIWGFGTTVALFVLFALVAGDSLIGELQFMLGSFFFFFVVLSLLIAWVF